MEQAVTRVEDTARSGVVNDTLYHPDTKLGIYEPVSYLGRGSYGKVYTVFNKKRQEQTALKIVKYIKKCPICVNIEEIHRELIIGSKLNSINGFIKLYDYFMSSGKPEEEENAVFKEILYEFDCSYIQPLCYMEMQLAEGDMHKLFLLGQDALTLVDKLFFFFEIVFALNLALKMFGLEHWDIAPRNILFVTNQEPRIYEIPNGNTRVVVNGHVRPLITDFGRTKIRDEHRLASFNDLSGLQSIAREWGFEFLRKLDEPRMVGKRWRTSELFYLSTYKDYDVLLMLIYDRIIELKNNTMIDKLKSATGLCSVCNRETPMVHVQSSQFFCDMSCYNFVEKI